MWHYNCNNSSMMKDKGMTLIETLTIIAIIGILATIAYPSFRGMILKIYLKKDVNMVYGDFLTAKANALEKGCDWDIIFNPEENTYTIFSDNGIVSAGTDGTLFTDDDIINYAYRNNGELDDITGETATALKRTLKFSWFGIPSNIVITKKACLNVSGPPPTNGVDFENNTLRFSYIGVARNGGAVYITNGKNVYAISVIPSTGKITVCTWHGAIWK